MTNLTKLLLWTLLVINYLIPEPHSGVTVSPLSITVLEGNNATARCIYDGDNSLQGVSFHLNQSTIAIIFLSNCTFNTLGFDNYITDCEGNKTVVITLVNVSRNEHGKTLTCTVFVYNSSPIRSSNLTLLTVNVSVKSVTLRKPSLEIMQENQIQLITCNSSGGRPIPRVKWLIRNPTETIKINLTQFSSNTIIPSDNGLKAVASSLNFKPNRTINGWRLYCEVWTRTSEADITSKELVVNVSYPPANLPVMQGINTNSIVSVIELDSGTFNCSITGGNPPAFLRWDCFGSTNVTYDIHENSRVTSTVNWKANRNQNTCSCTSEHINSWKRIINATFNVQYMEENNDNQVTYEKLADDRTDLNQYSQLHSMKEKQDGVITDIIQLTPTQLYANENSSATLTCSRTDGQSVSETIWKNSQIAGDANLYNFNRQCITSRFLKDSDLFGGLCNGDGTFSVILKKIDRTQHGAEWTCEELILKSNKVVLQVSVPATSVTLSQSNGNFMKENTTEKFICKASACRPEPQVQWYLRNSTGHVMQTLTQSSTHTYINGEYGLKAVESILRFSPNRTNNNLRLYCEVRTRADEVDIRSREIIVNVTYPPDNSPVIQEFDTSKIIQAIESDTGTFVCSISGGNPLASLSWNCFDSHDLTSSTQDGIVTNTVKWTAWRSYNTCSCTSNHVLSKWKRTTNVTVNVQFPPSKPHLKIGQTDVFGGVRVIENNTLRVACNSESNPLSNYTWTGPGFSGKGDTLEITSVKLSNQGNYKCMASNRMIRTNGSYEDGSNSSSLILTILYPPSNPKFKFENSSGPLIQSNIFYVVRNDTFSLYCDVKGNPVPDIKWDDNKSNPSLSISNINLDINSTCRATNLMKETASQKEIISKSEASFSIIVFYPPRVPTIHVANYNGDSVQVTNGNVSVIESETINVTCFSTSKPTPTYEWIHEQYMKTQSTNVLKFFNISRHESGTYACNVENNMKRSIGKTQVGENKSQIKLNILCK
ncbi:uncharacterized protein LOC132744506 [Ruditapes philippinarum]|uniref:uncharacterized protein LOC132744506 n=1 Tax=Ruditapes philippinarum TaxID=129788 RepID=UPI00295BD724|nr:uncharacterized protein LOC132744506 [Ruditapes philippinarum]